jgi:hypothetical protein
MSLTVVPPNKRSVAAVQNVLRELEKKSIEDLAKYCGLPVETLTQIRVRPNRRPVIIGREKPSSTELKSAWRTQRARLDQEQIQTEILGRFVCETTTDTSPGRRERTGIR